MRKFISVPTECKKGLIKCRVLYNEGVENIQFDYYNVRNVNNIKVVYDDDIAYSFKYAQRPQLDKLYAQKEDCNEILIVKNGLVTDAFYYNLVFAKGHQLFTPAKPLLEGTMRAKLLTENKLTLKDITPEEFNQYDSLYLINALTPLGKIRIPIGNILL
ncbi:MAG: aminotransferase class IV [Saprospiraceae bacterium]|nr:aminotransferase class IV [Saprospiraceae bacterium]